MMKPGRLFNHQRHIWFVALLFIFSARCQHTSQPTIALTTDFGGSDFYMGALKGAILAVNPQARLVDITHYIPKFDISKGSYTLWKASESYPPGTIFVTVVDPGVGTARRPVVVRLRNGHIHVAPDNGVLSDVVAVFGLEEARIISNPALMGNGSNSMSHTFHGRDIFGPVAAHLAAGVHLKAVGPVINDLILLNPEYGRRRGEAVEGRIRTVDTYGNAITNILQDTLTAAGWSLKGKYRVDLEDTVIVLPLTTTYGEVAEGLPMLVFGSGGFLELAVNRGNFAAQYHVRPGTSLNLSLIR